MDKFHKILSSWFKENKRILPWRDINSPYHVWISEIILQQTRVEQGISYYLRFIDRFPDIKTLAVASEEDVLLMWQGLGYYSRARNLHHAARQIMKDFNGQFPDSYNNILTLKGIGEYTASAISSISFGLPYAVIDGNVFRVLSRIFGVNTPIDTTIGKKEFSILANSLLDKRDPGVFNEAMMEFGALQCVPRKPSCSICPFMNQCIAYQKNQIEQLPVKSKQPEQKNRYFNYLFINCEDKYYLHKREEKDIWHNMYQFPLIETKTDLGETEVISTNFFKEYINGSEAIIESVTPRIIHQLTHQKLHIRFFTIRINVPIKNPKWILISDKQVSDYPFPNPIYNYLKR